MGFVSTLGGIQCHCKLGDGTSLEGLAHVNTARTYHVLFWESQL